MCAYFEPSFASQCSQNVAINSASVVVSYENFAIGYVVIDGTEALVGTTGTFCQSNLTPQCVTNTDPAAIFDTGQSFQTLWTEATTYTPSNGTSSYALLPCIEINGQWYLDSQGM